MMQGLSTATSVMYTSYFTVEGLAKNSGTIGMLSYLPILISIAVVNPLVKKFGKKKCSAVPLVAGIIGGILITVIPLPRGIVGVVLFVGLQFIISASVALLSMLSWAMIADCIDYQVLQTGRREEGTVYAIYSLGRKFAQGVGASVVLLIMGWLGFKSTTGDETIIQTFDVANNIRIMIGVIFTVCCLAQFIAIQYIYNLDKKRVEDMQIALGRVNEILSPHLED